MLLFNVLVFNRPTCTPYTEEAPGAARGRVLSQQQDDGGADGGEGEGDLVSSGVDSATAHTIRLYVIISDRAQGDTFKVGR